MKKQGETDFMPSRLFVYYNERVIEGTVSEDDGACLRDGMKAISQQGVCSEVTWTYDITKFAVTPPQTAYDEGKLHLATQYLSVSQDVNSMKAVLALGNPICFGFQVYNSFEGQATAVSGLVSMPDVNNEQCLGGHAVLLCGYQADGSWIVRNSWGTGWGDPKNPGYCYFPQNYLLNPNLASDFWVIKLVE